MQDLVKRFSQVLGRPIRVTPIPRLIVTAMGVVVPLMREVNEMLYQWDEPFVVDDRHFRERFGMHPTDAGEAAQATVNWAKAAYGLHQG
ncbi:MAG: hypothetical protein M1118_12230 [Chloroflexi bacterium]|nr:hypothetical protein [Chloroflexota bacterium]